MTIGVDAVAPSPRPQGKPLRLWRAAAHRLPGVARVAATVPQFADDWRIANAHALSCDGPLWVVLGDSMSQGVGATSIRGGWVGQVQDNLSAHGRAVRVVNLSMTGARVGDVLHEQLPEMRRIVDAPSLVTVLVGANDMFPRRRWGGALVGYRHLLDALPAGRTVVGALPRRNAAAIAIDAMIADAAAAGRVDVADMGTFTWRSVVGTRAADFFHPNERGYAAIAEQFGRAIDRVLSTRNEANAWSQSSR